jgi:hypothetical protein
LKVREITMATVLLCGGCGTGETPHPADSRQAAPPPPAMPSRESAVEAARSAGAGSCKEDVPNIKVLPLKGVLGLDARYDRIVVHGPAYADCLLEMVKDARPIADPGQGPGRHPYALGDLAYDLLSHTGSIAYGDCIPPAVLRSADSVGSMAVYRWLDTSSNRRKAYECLAAARNGAPSP